MAPLPSVILSAQGVITVLNGLASLVSSRVASSNMELLSIASLPAIHSIGLGSVSIGALYIFAARNNDRAAMWATVVGRVAAVFVFWRHGGPWRNVAIYEGVSGALMVGALGWEAWREDGRVKRS